MSDWRAQALCAQVGGNWWFPEDGEHSTIAKRICNVCPVQQECLEVGMSESVGVWGGKSARERRKMRRNAA